MLSRRRVGPKRRRLVAPPAIQLSTNQWYEKLKCSGKDGGFSAECVDVEVLQKRRLDAVNTGKIHFQSETGELATQDLWDMSRSLPRAKKRKNVPPGSVPTEIWGMLMSPNYCSKKINRDGVGREPPKLACPYVRRCLWATFAKTRESQCVPLRWNHGKAAFLPPGKKQRVIGMFDGVSKQYFKNLWEKSPDKSEPLPIEFGYRRGVSREEPILIQLCLSWRLAKLGINTINGFYDMTNAFFCTSHDDLEMAAHRELPHRDSNIMIDRIRNSILRIEVGDEQVDVRVKQGMPPGQEKAAELFACCFRRNVDDWIRETDEYSTFAEVNWVGIGSKVDLGVSGYADDLARKLPLFGAFGKSVVPASHKALAITDKVMVDGFALSGYKPNNYKRVIVPKFVGLHSENNLRKLARLQPVLRSPVTEHTRYLGPQFTASALSNVERSVRIQTAEICFGAMGSFWWRGPRRFAKAVFQCVICNTIWSAMICFVLVKADYDVFDKTILGFTRRLMKGKATDKTGEHMVKMSNHDTWRWLGCADTFTELRIRRLRFWQRVAADAEKHMCVIAVLFSRLDAEEGQRKTGGDILGMALPDSNPWLLQLRDDIESLQEYDDLYEICEVTDGKLLRLFLKHEARDLFINADFSQIKSKFLSKNVAPPGFAPPPQADGPINVDDVSKMYSCAFVYADGSKCGKSYNKYQAFTMHRRAHGDTNVVRKCVLSNKCPVCQIVFRDVEYVKQHLQRAQQAGLRWCSQRARGPRIAIPELPPSTLLCPICMDEHQYASNEHLRLHLVSVHVPFDQQPPLDNGGNGGSGVGEHRTNRVHASRRKRCW